MPAAGAGAGGAAGTVGSGGAVVVLGGTSLGGAPERARAVCENEFVEVLALPQDVELGFVGTVDGRATQLVSAGDQPSMPTFSLLRFGQHLEAVSLSLSMTEAPGELSVQMSVADCKLNAFLFNADPNSPAPFTLEFGWLRSTTVTADWQTGTTTGSLHLELVKDSGSLRRVLDGNFVWPAALSEARLE